MRFSEKIKLEVKENADFRCCRCHSIGVDVHHIIPEKDRGSNDIDNAAPLCQNCHDQFGDNPLKRKEITQMRDAWYKKVEQIFTNKIYDTDLHKKVDMLVNQVKDVPSSIGELQGTLKILTNRFIENITPDTARNAATDIIAASTGTSITHLGEFTCEDST